MAKRIAKPEQRSEEFDRFEDLAKRLVAVPKRELDEARKRDARKRNGSSGK